MDSAAGKERNVPPVSDPQQRHDCAVALCCDRKFLPLALFVIRQIVHHNPFRQFDIVIASHEALDLPDWASGYGIIQRQIAMTGAAQEVARQTGKAAYLLRLMLPRELGDRYRRILYMDCDMFVEGGNFSRLLQIDLGPHVLGAVLDVPHFCKRTYLAPEFARLNLNPRPYFNAGLMLIDTAAFQAQQIERRCLAVWQKHQHAMRLFDQSMLNVVLRGTFAQLAPCWNWQTSGPLTLVSQRYPAFVRHFSGREKPDAVQTPDLDARFNQAYRDHMTSLEPQLLPQLAKPCDPTPMGLSGILALAMKHLWTRKAVTEVLRRHPDPYLALV